MDEIQQLSAMLASGNAEQVKQAQSRLKALGFYTGNIDGSLGKNPQASETMAALQRFQAVETQKAQKTQNDLRAQELELKKLELQQSGQKGDVEAKAAEADLARKQKYTEQEMSPLGMATQSAGSVGAPILAGAAGLRFGDQVNKWMDKGQEGRNVTLRGAAADRVKGLTTREGAITGTRLAGAMPPSNAVMRVGGRMAPHIALGALSAGKGLQLLSDVDEDQAFYPRMADRAAGLGYLGFAGGILKRGIQQAQSPGVSPDAQALSVINSSQLRRNNAQPDEPAPKPPTPRGMLVEQAKAAGIKNIGKKNMGQLQAALDAMNKGTKGLPKGALAGPLAAGTLAYALTPDRAEAADGSSAGGQAEALTNAAGAGGVAYGVQRGLRALPAAVGRAAGAGGSMLGPMSAGDMTDMTQPELNQGRNWMARNAPALAVGPGMRQAYDMAQVPTQAPVKTSEGPRAQLAMAQLPSRGDRSPGLLYSPGMIQPGNIDLGTRPQVRNPDGSISTVRSMSFESDGREVVVPTVSDDGRIMSDDEAAAGYMKGGKHLGIFNSPTNAERYARNLHGQQDRFYSMTPAAQRQGADAFADALAQFQALMAEAQ